MADDELGFVVCNFEYLGIIMKLISDYRLGFARLADLSIRTVKSKREIETLGTIDEILNCTINRALATWNRPIEIRVETQSARKDKDVTVKLTIRDTLAGIYAKDGIKVFIPCIGIRDLVDCLYGSLC